MTENAKEFMNDWELWRSKPKHKQFKNEEWISMKLKNEFHLQRTLNLNMILKERVDKFFQESDNFQIYDQVWTDYYT